MDAPASGTDDIVESPIINDVPGRAPRVINTFAGVAEYEDEGKGAVGITESAKPSLVELAAKCKDGDGAATGIAGATETPPEELAGRKCKDGDGAATGIAGATEAPPEGLAEIGTCEDGDGAAAGMTGATDTPPEGLTCMTEGDSEDEDEDDDTTGITGASPSLEGLTTDRVEEETEEVGKGIDDEGNTAAATISLITSG